MRLVATPALIAMACGSAPAPHPAAPSQHRIALDQAVQAAGLTIRLVNVTTEEIAESPDDPQAYPAGSGVVVVLEVSDGTQTERLEFSQLSTGYQSVVERHFQGRRIVLRNVEPHGSAPTVAIELYTQAAR